MAVPYPPQRRIQNHEEVLKYNESGTHQETICFILFLPYLLYRFTNNIKFKNQTSVSEFLLLGLTDDPELQPLIFNLFLIIYLVTILGNLLIILAISSDSHLHTPMYFFLSNLSFTDICISTTTIPKMLVNIHTQDQRISYTGCFSQLCFALIFGCLENCLLVVMAYDRYAAICHPLRYTVIMHPYLCFLLVVLSLLMGIVHGLLHSLVALPLSFCTNMEIPHFFCELAQIIKLACSDTFINAMLIYSAGNIVFGVPLIGIIFSYVKIVSCVLRMPSVGGRYKAFSTCGSQLFVVSFFYGTGFGVYLSSTFSKSSNKNAVASVMYIVIPQVMNPFIYSLRNKEMKTALKSLITWKPFVMERYLKVPLPRPAGPTGPAALHLALLLARTTESKWPPDGPGLASLATSAQRVKPAGAESTHPATPLPTCSLSRLLPRPNQLRLAELPGAAWRRQGAGADPHRAAAPAVGR
ncbi:olfactory receptor 7G1-like [Heterocephalus glaber]|uniref:Olfactory receptor 7G1-like n=1 Tax=Heterocephalus glaber TaxID=10181 RepID=A0AAX6SIS7_HETGA|nr:olfactory receptor 7G1-like [Heterocephalus glaber]